MNKMMTKMLIFIHVCFYSVDICLGYSQPSKDEFLHRMEMKADGEFFLFIHDITKAYIPKIQSSANHPLLVHQIDNWTISVQSWNVGNIDVFVPLLISYGANMTEIVAEVDKWLYNRESITSLDIRCDNRLPG